jgi:FixJ family two-component response regulator
MKRIEVRPVEAAETELSACPPRPKPDFIKMLAYAAKGWTTQAMAEPLGLTEHGVKARRKRCMAHLGVHSIHLAIRIARGPWLVGFNER